MTKHELNTYSKCGYRRICGAVVEYGIPRPFEKKKSEVLTLFFAQNPELAKTEPVDYNTWVARLFKEGKLAAFKPFKAKTKKELKESSSEGINKVKYAEMLTKHEWADRRKQIMTRDQFCCRKCPSKSDLQVHHIWYIKGNLPWEAPDNHLITLCRTCHKLEHKDRHISSFVLDKDGEPKKVKPPKIKKQKTKSVPKGTYNNFKSLQVKKANKRGKNPSGAKIVRQTILSGADKALQKKYDQLRKSHT